MNRNIRRIRMKIRDANQRRDPKSAARLARLASRLAAQARREAETRGIIFA